MRTILAILLFPIFLNAQDYTYHPSGALETSDFKEHLHNSALWYILNEGNIKHDFTEIDNKAKNLSASTAQNLADKIGFIAETKFEKLRAAYIWMIFNCEYSSLPKYDNQPDLVFSDHKGDCESFSYAMVKVCSLMGVDCGTVIDYGETFKTGSGKDPLDGHIYNSYEIGIDTYYLDVTYGLQDSYASKNDADYYFLMNTVWESRKRYSLTDKPFSTFIGYTVYSDQDYHLAISDYVEYAFVTYSEEGATYKNPITDEISVKYTAPKTLIVSSMKELKEREYRMYNDAKNKYDHIQARKKLYRATKDDTDDKDIIKKCIKMEYWLNTL